MSDIASRKYTGIGYKSAGQVFGFSLLFGLSGALQAQTDETEEKPLHPAAQSPATHLETLTVWGQAATEDNNSYTTDRTTVATKLPVALKDIPQSVSVITRQRIEDQHMVTLEDALKQVNGVTVIPNDSSQSQFLSRGYGLNVSIDGVPSTGGLSGAEQFDLAVYDRVEVLRGPAGVLNGSGDLGGTVNVVTKKPRNQFALNGTLSTGSWNNQRGEIDITGPLNESKSLRGRFVGVAQDRDFFYDKAHQNKEVGYGVLEYDLTPDTTLSITHTAQNNDVDASYSGLPAFADGTLLDVSRSTNPTPDWARTYARTQETVLGLEQRFDNGWSATAKVRRLKQDYGFKDTFAWSGVNPQTWTLSYARPRDFDYEYERHAVDTYLSGPVNWFGREHQFLLGYNYEDYDRRYTGGRGGSIINGVSLFHPNIPEPSIAATSGGQTRTEQSGVYGQARLKLLDPLTLVLGGRSSDYEVKTRSRSPSTPSAWDKGESVKGHFTPYGGVVYELTPQVSLYGSYSDIFIPSDDEKAGGGTLEPRVGNQYEIGVKGSFFDGALNASLATFRINDENRPMTDPQNPDYYIASGKVESKGWEAEVSGSPLHGWDLAAGYTHLTTRYLKDDSNSGIFSSAEPKHTLKLWSHYRFDQGLLDGLSLGGGVNAVSSYAGSRGTSVLREQSGYALVSAVASYALSEHLTLALNGENLTDRKYYASIGGLNTYNTYGDPRNFTLSLRAQY
nr:TonB-dependent siderophore receptor [Pseudomonas chlororaphis]